jgi:SET domain-containing protein
MMSVAHFLRTCVLADFACSFSCKKPPMHTPLCSSHTPRDHSLCMDLTCKMYEVERHEQVSNRRMNLFQARVKSKSRVVVSH